MGIKKRLLRLANRSLVLTGLAVSPTLAVGIARGINRRFKLDPQLNKRQLRENLRDYFPERDEAWVEATARAIQNNVLRARLFDKHFLPKLANDELDRVVENVDWHIPEAALLDKRGFIIASIHFGRFWASPLWFSRHGYMSAAFQSSKGRLPAEADTLSAGSLNANDPTSTLRAVRALKKGAVVFLILDAGKMQNPIVVDFLGRPTRVSAAAYRLARAADALVIPALAHIDSDDPEHIKVKFERPVDPREVPADEPIEVTMRRILEPLEAHVRATPSQWYGFLNAHRRLARDADEADV
jgi:lauroyl/myristoyl acyltransferase